MKSKSSSGLPHYLFALIAVIVVHFLCLRYLQGFDFYGGGGIRWIPFFISFLPPLFLFSLIAVVLSGELSATLVTILEIVLSLIHRKKVVFLGEPLNGGDLFNIVGHKIGIRYLTIFDWTLVLCLLVVVILQFRFVTYRKKKKLIGFSLSSLLFALIISPLVLFPHLQNRSFFGQEWINH